MILFKYQGEMKNNGLLESDLNVFDMAILRHERYLSALKRGLITFDEYLRSIEEINKSLKAKKDIDALIEDIDNLDREKEALIKILEGKNELYRIGALDKHEHLKSFDNTEYLIKEIDKEIEYKTNKMNGLKH